MLVLAGRFKIKTGSKIRSILSGFPFKTPYLRWLLYPALNAMGADAKIVTTVTAVVKRRSRKIVA